MKIREIQDFATVIRGASPRPKGDPKYYGGNIPRLMVEDVTRDGKYVSPAVDFLTEEGAKRSRPCKAGTLTVVCSGAVGIPSFLKVDACIHDGFLAIVDIDNTVDSQYLFYQLSYLKNELDRTATHGGVFTNLTTSILKTTKVPIFPLIQQRRVAEILTTVDSQIEKTEALIRKYEMVKEGMMQDLFTRGIDPATGRLRPSVEEAPELYWESALGWVPKGWKVTLLDDVASTIDPQPDHRTPPEFLNGIPYVGINDVSDLGVPKAGCRTVAHSIYVKQSKRFQIKDGDIIYGKIGTIGFPKRLSAGQKLTLSANVILIKPQINSTFFFWSIKANYVEKQVSISSHSTSQAAFGMDKIKKIKILLPEPEECGVIGRAFENIYILKTKETEKLEAYKCLKSALMQDLLTGKILVPTKETASCPNTATSSVLS